MSQQHSLRCPLPSSPSPAKTWSSSSPSTSSSSPMGRRNSNSFKLVSTGSLVSNSPFINSNSTATSSAKGGGGGGSAAGKALHYLSSTPNDGGGKRLPTTLDSSLGGGDDDQSQNRKLSGEIVNPNPTEGDGEKRSTSPLYYRSPLPIPAAGNTPFRPTRSGFYSTTSPTKSLYSTSSSSSTFSPPPHPQPQPQLSYSPSNSTHQTILSSPKRVKGPRPVSVSPQEEQDQRQLNHKASSKTVTFAETEEVLEFDNEGDGGRSSLASSTTSTSTSTEIEDGEEERGYSSEEDDEERVRRRRSLSEELGEEDVSYEEGGSLIVHELSDDGLDEIDEFLSDDVFKFKELSKQLGRSSYDGGNTGGGSSAKFSGVSSSGLGYDDGDSEVGYRKLALTNYSEEEDEGEEEAEDGATNSSYSSSGEDGLAPPPPQPVFHRDLPSPLDVPSSPTVTTATGMSQSNSAYSLPDLPDNSPFMGFTHPNGSQSDVGSDLVLPSTTTSYNRNHPPNSLIGLAPMIVEKSTSSSVASSSISSGSGSRFEEMRNRILERHRLGGSGVGSGTSSGISDEVLISSPINRSTFDSPIPNNNHYHMFDSPATTSSPTHSSLLSTPQNKFFTISPATPDLFSPASNTSTRLDTDDFPSPPLTPATKLFPQSPSKSHTMERIKSVEYIRVPEKVSRVVDSDSGSPLERLERGELLGTGSGGVGGGSGSSRRSGRRSLSTGDVDLRAECSKAMEKRATMPEGKFRLVDDQAVAGGFAMGLQSSFDSIIRNSNRNYVVREHNRIVYANDGEVETVGKAGDVDPGRAWRKKRPSDMNIVNSFSTTSMKKLKDPLAGHVYVKIVELVLDDLPIPRGGETNLDIWLNNGKAHVKTPESYILAPKVIINKEYDLTASTLLALDVEFIIPRSTASNSHLLQNTNPLPKPQPSPMKSPSKLRAFFSNPLLRSESKQSLRSPSKKSLHNPPPPVPNRLVDYLEPSSGALGRAHLKFSDYATKCRGRKIEISLPLEKALGKTGEGRPRLVKGSVVLSLFFLPNISGMGKARDTLPLSSEEAIRGLKLVDEVIECTHQGVLTQFGGDCTTLRRRNFKVKGAQLIPYSEVTKKAYVEIDLGKAIAVMDPDEAVGEGPKSPKSIKGGMSRSGSLGAVEDDPVRMNKNGFKIVFGDESEISFFADSATEKKDWVKVLRRMVGRKELNPPEWAVRFRKMKVPVEEGGRGTGGFLAPAIEE